MRLPFWATTCTALGVVILCGLGTWQLQRLEWKKEIIQGLDEAYTQNPDTPLTPKSLANQSFAMGQINGIFRYDKRVMIGPKPLGEEIGYNILVPVETPETTYLVDMGWGKEGTRYNPKVMGHANGDSVRISGLAYKPSWSGFTPANQPEDDIWFKADIQEIATAKNLPNPAPFVIRAFFSSYKFDAAFPHNERYYPENNHQQYALFWFGMAGILVVIYALRFLKKSPR